MSYANPTIPTIPTPTGLNKVIGAIQNSLATAHLSWMQKSFGRAWVHEETDAAERKRKVPKVYIGEGEYLNVLPNDNLVAQSFIACKGPEVWEQFNRAEGSMKSRKMSVIIWVDMSAIDNTKDYIFIDQLKDQVEDILKSSPYIKSIDECYDEKASDIFDGYDIDDATTQYLMYPYGGMRFDITVNYDEVC